MTTRKADLLRALGHPDPEVRWDAILRLEMSDESDATALLIEALGQEEEMSIPWLAAIALGERGDSSAVPALIKALEAENPYLRAEAAGALGRIVDPRAIRPLARHLRDSFRLVRFRALYALKKICISENAEECGADIRKAMHELENPGSHLSSHPGSE